MRVDLHVHTEASYDSQTTLAELETAAALRGLDAVAITDHDTADGALEYAARSRTRIIVGEEILTREGEVIGLFLRQTIPPGLSAEETCRRIHEQGGLTYVPHPTDRVRRRRLGSTRIAALRAHLDIIEARNAKAAWPWANVSATALGRSLDLALGAGSDAHRAEDIGAAWVDVAAWTTPAEFLVAVRGGVIGGGARLNPLVPIGVRLAKLAARLRGPTR